MLSAWRIVKRKYQADAFSGEGARRYGGRWNSPGTAVVYTAGSQSLAALEMLIHLEAQELLFHYVVFQMTFDQALMRDLDSPLPKGWDAEPSPRKVRLLGDAWVRDRTSAILRLPSAVVHSEYNYLLNPNHPSFGKIQIAKAVPFRIHRRLQQKLR